MADLNNAKIYKKVSNTGTDKYAVVNLDATNFCITIGGSTSSLVNALSGFVDTSSDSQEIGATKIFSKYLVVWDDEEESEDAPRPDNSIYSGHDLDVYFYSTGMTVRDNSADQNYQYSYPNHSGTFAMTNDIGLQVLDLRLIR